MTSCGLMTPWGDMDLIWINSFNRECCTATAGKSSGKKYYTRYGGQPARSPLPTTAYYKHCKTGVSLPVHQPVHQPAHQPVHPISIWKTLGRCLSGLEDPESSRWRYSHHYQSLDPLDPVKCLLSPLSLVPILPILPPQYSWHNWRLGVQQCEIISLKHLWLRHSVMVALDDLGCIIPCEPSYQFTVCQTIYSQSVTPHSTL